MTANVTNKPGIQTPSTAEVFEKLDEIASDAQRKLPQDLYEGLTATEFFKHPNRLEVSANLSLPERSSVIALAKVKSAVKLKIPSTTMRVEVSPVTREDSTTPSITLRTDSPIVLRNPIAMRHGDSWFAAIADCFVSTVLERVERTDSGWNFSMRTRLFGFIYLPTTRLSLTTEELRTCYPNPEPSQENLFSSVINLALFSVPVWLHQPVREIVNAQPNWIWEMPFPVGGELHVKAQFASPAIIEHCDGAQLELPNWELCLEAHQKEPQVLDADYKVSGFYRTRDAVLRTPPGKSQFVQVEAKADALIEQNLISVSSAGTFAAKCVGTETFAEAAAKFNGKMGLSGIAKQWDWTTKPRFSPSLSAGREDLQTQTGVLPNEANEAA